MPKEPWKRWFPGDWLSDPAVSLCSPATRGVWMDMLMAMYILDRFGKLSGTTEELARLCRCSTSDVSSAIAELQATGAADVTERNGRVTVINRRQLRESQERENTRIRVKKYRDKESCNGDGNADVTQQKRESNKSPSLSPPIPPPISTPGIRSQKSDVRQAPPKSPPRGTRPGSSRKFDASEPDPLLIERVGVTFSDDFKVVLSPDTLDDIRDRMKRNWPKIERDFLTYENFLTVMFRRLRDIRREKKEEDKTIGDPLAFFLAGTFGKKRYLWETTKTEEDRNHGGSYTRELLDNRDWYRKDDPVGIADMLEVEHAQS